MMRLFINSLAASAGGGLTYIRNVLPYFAADSTVQLTVALSSELKREFDSYRNVDLLPIEASAKRRPWYEQSILPAMIRKAHADVLLSTGNFALRRSPVPQVLLSRNSIYCSSDFYRDLLLRHEYRAWLETRARAIFAKKSIAWADITVAPSEAFAEELRRWTGRNAIAIHHGFDYASFVKSTEPLAPEVKRKLQDAQGRLKLLFVSHYNYYRNFETLIRSLPLLRDRLGDRKVKVLLTCSLAEGKNPGWYRPESAANLVRELGVSDMVVELGAIPYHQLHTLYSSADLYVTPSYAETFAHPLVEAMACGLPVVASDLAVHREICQGAAVFFPRWSPETLAEMVVRTAGNPDQMKAMSLAGRERSRNFSWEDHVHKIVEVCTQLCGTSSGNAREAKVSAKRETAKV
jgi:glycosyltransferase involved in cell wall biosynthesis